MVISIVWFRRDLRLQGNAALQAACASGAVVPVYIHNSEEQQPWPMGAASRWYAHQSLEKLDASLKALQSQLFFEQGDNIHCLLSLARRVGAKCIMWNRIYEPEWVKRDGVTKQVLEKSGFEVKIFHDHALFKPGEVLNKAGLPYQVFTPYWRALSPNILQVESSSLNRSLADISCSITPVINVQQSTLSLDELGLLDDHSWHEKLHAHWQAGEAAAASRLAFMLTKLAQYPQQRDYPAVSATSGLSAALHFGEVSAWQIVQALHPTWQGEMGSKAAQGAEALVRQLAWREFAINLIYQHPCSDQVSLNTQYEQSDIWGYDEILIRKWQRGETGFALVDAGMQQLWQTGTMHNRVRMVVASFLTKNLGQHWLHGARWFWDTLVDADLPNNTMGWQWVAGCGCDAAPYYRIFNPETQAKRFDSKGEYCDRWLQGKPNVERLVDLNHSRQAALDRYAVLRDTNA